MKEKVSERALAKALLDSAETMRRLSDEVSTLRAEKAALKEKLAEIKGAFAIEKVLTAMENHSVFPDDMSRVDRRRLVRDNFDEYKAYLNQPAPTVRLSADKAPDVNHERRLLNELAQN